MKTRLLIIGITVIVLIGFLGTAFATHDPTYNHPTPPESELPPCASTRDACQNPPICENTMWNCEDHSEIFLNPDDFSYQKHSCELMIFDLWQPTAEGREWAKNVLDKCVKKGIITQELADMAPSLRGYGSGSITSAYSYAKGDIWKTIEILQDPDFPRNIPGHPDSYIVDFTTGNGYNYYPIIIVGIGVVIFTVIIMKKRKEN